MSTMKSRARRVSAGRVAAVIVAVVAGVAAFVLLGALVARLVGGGALAWGSAYLVALLACLVLPVFLGVRIAGSEPWAPIVTGAIATVNVTWLLLLLGLAPTASRAALHSHGTWFLGGAGPASLAGGIAGLGDHIPRSEAPEVEAPPPDASSAPADAGVVVVAAAPEGPWTASELFEHRADSVVTIQVRIPVDDDDPLAELLGEAGMEMREGSGSGFIVSADGVIVTNHHVIGAAASARVVLRDGRAFDRVSLLATDPANDLGVIQIPADDLPVAPLAPAGEPDVGATVFAFGSPLGLDHTLTQGIVSAIRNESGTTFVQMQAPIAPGSSGGPLFDQLGRVVGVNTAARTAGLYFAVRVDHVRELLDGPRLPRPLAPYGDAPHAVSIEVEGAPILPTTRMTLEPLGVAVAQLGARCIETWPPQDQAPVFTVTVGRRARDSGVTADQGEAVDRCLLQAGGTLVGLQAAMIARQAGGSAFTATVRVEGIAPRGERDGRAVVVRFVREDR